MCESLITSSTAKFIVCRIFSCSTCVRKIEQVFIVFDGLESLNISFKFSVFRIKVLKIKEDFFEGFFLKSKFLIEIYGEILLTKKNNKTKFLTKNFSVIES